MSPNFLFPIKMLFQSVPCNCALFSCEYVFLFYLEPVIKRIRQEKSLMHDTDWMLV